jgi:hypothetical protein
VPPAQTNPKRKKEGDGEKYTEDKPMRGRKEKDSVRRTHKKYPFTRGW